MSESNGYNGWSNYETWLVSLHIDNDPGLYDQTLRMAGRVRDRYPLHNNLEDFTERSAEHELTEQLESMIRDIVDREDINSMLAADLIHGAINSVDFREIAESKLREAQEVEV